MNARDRELERLVAGARDAGADFFKWCPECLLVEAFWRAWTLYADVRAVEAFVEGFQAARRQRDEFEQERGR